MVVGGGQVYGSVVKGRRISRGVMERSVVVWGGVVYRAVMVGRGSGLQAMAHSIWHIYRGTAGAQVCWHYKETEMVNSSTIPYT